MNYWDSLPKPFFVLAPMDDVTDSVFRQTTASLASPDMFFTEFVNVDGLQSPGRKNLLKKLQFSETEDKLVAQIWGKDPENFYKTAKQIADGTFANELGLEKVHNYIGVDLNMGCPQKNEVNGETCSALINNRELASEIIEATQEGLQGKLPMSVKTRLGFNEIDLTWIEHVLKHQPKMLTIHARTRREMSKVPAHHEYFKDVVELKNKLSSETLIVGNGDIMTRSMGEQLAKEYHLDGVMIGRGVFNDPFVFSSSSPWLDYSKEQKIDLYKKQVELFKSTWKNNERPIYTLNKFCKVYINGFSNAKEIREKLMSARDSEDLLSKLNQELEAELSLSR
jgi:tRNA-dihydrouridine synthase